MADIQLFDRSNIHKLCWSDYTDGEYTRAFLEPLVLEGVPAHIENIHTELMVLTVNKLLLPLTVNDGEYENAYVCSPYTHYIKASLEQIEGVQNYALKSSIKGLFSLLSGIFKWGKINKVIGINNWLLPTLLHPNVSEEELDQITQFLIKKFPQHALFLRSLNEKTHPELLHNSEKKGYAKILSRPIYVLDTSSSHIFKSNMLKKDLKLLENSPYTIEDTTELSEQDIAKVKNLYKSIYIEKYTKLSSAYTERFIKQALEHKILSFKVLKKEGNIEGAFGYLVNNGVMTMPFFGYDRHVPADQGLYRLISISLILEAKRLNHILHLSSGAASFKKLRRAEQHMEYSAIYYQHLPIRKKIPWVILKTLTPPGRFILKKLSL